MMSNNVPLFSNHFFFNENGEILPNVSQPFLSPPSPWLPGRGLCCTRDLPHWPHELPGAEAAGFCGAKPTNANKIVEEIYSILVS